MQQETGIHHQIPWYLVLVCESLNYILLALLNFLAFTFIYFYLFIYFFLLLLDFRRPEVNVTTATANVSTFPILFTISFSEAPLDFSPINDVFLSNSTVIRNLFLWFWFRLFFANETAGNI